MVLPTEMTLINDDMIGYLKVPLGNYAVLLRILQDLHVFFVLNFGVKNALKSELGWIPSTFFYKVKIIFLERNHRKTT